MCWLEKADPCLSECIIEGSDRLIDADGYQLPHWPPNRCSADLRGGLIFCFNGVNAGAGDVIKGWDIGVNGKYC